MLVIRSLLFNLLFYLNLLVQIIAALPTLLMPRWGIIAVATFWARTNLWLLRVICGIKAEFRGLGKIPPGPLLVSSKHQSLWETFALLLILPDAAYIMKRELLWIPFFGWGLALTSPIAIDRSSGGRALKRIAELGRERLAQGFWITIFPEGTRVPPGRRGTYHRGGAWLAVHCGAPVVPVAHNAGLLWGRKAFLKHPGTVTVEIGAAIDVRDHTPDSLNATVEQWIEGRMLALCPRS